MYTILAVWFDVLACGDVCILYWQLSGYNGLMYLHVVRYVYYTGSLGVMV